MCVYVCVCVCMCVCEVWEREREREQQSGVQGSALNFKLSCITFILGKGSGSEFHLFPMDINGLSGRWESIWNAVICMLLLHCLHRSHTGEYLNFLVLSFLGKFNKTKIIWYLFTGKWTMSENQMRFQSETLTVEEYQVLCTIIFYKWKMALTHSFY